MAADSTRLPNQAQLAIPKSYETAYRVQGLPSGCNRTQAAEIIKSALKISDQETDFKLRSLAHGGYRDDKVATISFTRPPQQLLGNRSSLSSRYEQTFDVLDWLAGYNGATEDAELQNLKITIDNHFEGFTVLNSFDDPRKHKIDCIAISGLGGHAFGSFKKKGGSYMWIRDRLPSDIAGMRILIYGYDSTLSGSQSFQNIRDMSGKLRRQIMSIRRNCLNEDGFPRPMIYVAHSLGGLILKEALVKMKDGDVLDQDNLSSTYGMLLFGVPNQGMDIQSLRPMVQNQPNQYMLHSLSQESDLLHEQHDNFSHAFHFTDSKIICFYETKMSETAELQGDQWRMTSKKPAILVSSASATHGRSWEVGDRYVVALNRTHSELVKFSQHDDDYEMVRDCLQQFADAAFAVIQKRFSDRFLSEAVQGRHVQESSSQQNESMSPDLADLVNHTVSDLSLIRGSRNSSPHSQDQVLGLPRGSPSPVPGARFQSPLDTPPPYSSALPAQRIEDDMRDRNSPALHEKDQNLLDELYTVDFEAEAFRIETRDSLLESTGSWIFADSKFSAWREADCNQILWISGERGTGKTMLTLSLIKILQIQIEDNGTTTVGPRSTLAYFFCNRLGDVEETVETGTVIRSLLYQILYQQPLLISKLRVWYTRRRKTLATATMAVESLTQLLLTALSLSSCSEAYLVVDAIEQCHMVSFKRFLTLISHTHSLMYNIPGKSSCQVKWLLTSRTSGASYVNYALAKAIKLSLDQTPYKQHVASSVQEYVNLRVEGISKSHQTHRTVEEQRVLREKLMELANGTFDRISKVCSELEVLELDSYDQVEKRVTELADAKNGLTFLTHCARQNRVSDVVRLLDFDADITATTDIENSFRGRHWNVLHLAAHNNHLKLVEILLSRGANVESATERSWRPLHFASRVGHLDCVKLLLKHKAEVDAETGSTDGSTPLQIAASAAHEEVCRYLVWYGADVHLRSGSSTMTTLLLACRNPTSLPIIQFLLQHKVDVTAAVKINYDFDFGDKHTALHLLARSDTVDVSARATELLVQHGANVQAETTYGIRPLHIAALWKRLDVVKVLTRENERVNVKDMWSQTPLHYAMLDCAYQKDDVEMVQLLIDKGAKVDAKDVNLNTPLTIAVGTILEKVRTFDPRRIAGSEKEKTLDPGGIAFRNGENNLYAVIELLLKHRANINVKAGKVQQTSLQVAKNKCNERMIKFLVENGALEEDTGVIVQKD